MFRKLFIYFIILFISSCVSLKQNSHSYDSLLALMIDTAPIEDKPVFLGMSPLFMEEGKTEETCLEYAAWQASRFLYVNSFNLYFYYERNDAIMNYEDALLSVDTGLIESLKDELVVIGRHETSKDQFILYELPSKRIEINYKPGTRLNTAPYWINNIPNINGYDVSVGVSARQFYFSDSVYEADMNALTEMVAMKSGVNIKTVTSTSSRNSEYLNRETFSKEESTGVLEGFYIISRWYSPDGNYIYSLAVSSKNIK